MKNLWLIAASFVVLLGNMHPASAFSTDQTGYQNRDGASNLTDPDEQKPGFMVGPTNGGNGSGVLSLGDGVSGSVTPPTPGDVSPGAAAFDHAYAHQDNRD